MMIHGILFSLYFDLLNLFSFSFSCFPRSLLCDDLGQDGGGSERGEVRRWCLFTELTSADDVKMKKQ
ncbi:hypothetical protein OIU84_009277, partial [Salix udensis]